MKHSKYQCSCFIWSLCFRCFSYYYSL